MQTEHGPMGLRNLNLIKNEITFMWHDHLLASNYDLVTSGSTEITAKRREWSQPLKPITFLQSPTAGVALVTSDQISSDER